MAKTSSRAVALTRKLLVLMSWLGGLDSNQDSQIQSLESYQLDDLPVENRALKLQHGLYRWVKWVNLNEISNTIKLILNELGTKMRVALYHLRCSPRWDLKP